MLEGEEAPVPSSLRVRERRLSAAFTLPARCPYGVAAGQRRAQAETHIQRQEAAQFTQADTKWPRGGSFAPQLTGAIRPWRSPRQGSLTPRHLSAPWKDFNDAALCAVRSQRR